ncbi:MAG: hypothetical protein RIS39_786, partial [Actinomycetota bacterium]
VTGNVKQSTQMATRYESVSPLSLRINFV